MSVTRVLLIAIVSFTAACGQAPTRPTVTEQPPIVTPPSSPTPVVLSISSLSPATAIAGSADITVTITGSGFPPQLGVFGAFAVWSADTLLLTRYVSDTQLTAVIPASLLKDPATAQVLVVNGSTMGWSDGYRGYPQSNALPFAIVGSR